MTDAWIPLALLVAGLAVVIVFRILGRPKPVIFDDAREERLTKQVAQVIRCAPAQALAAVRREVAIAPNESDETILKRAVYHCRQELPEAPGAVYHDPAPR